MKTLICPISTQRINHHVVRLTGLMMAGMIALYLLTGNIIFIVAIVVDYYIRAFTSLHQSPAGWIAARVVRALDWPVKLIDKAPKIFAARVGWLFAAASAVLYFIHPPASAIVAATLMGFALLESLLDFCLGCVVYTTIVFPPDGRVILTTLAKQRVSWTAAQ